MGEKSFKSREYIGFAEAANMEWMVLKEADGRKKWTERWAPYLEEHEKWVSSGIGRGLIRKPSHRALEWLVYNRTYELPAIGEMNTRKGIFLEPERPQCCKPCPWPVTTYGEVGWLGQHRCCQLDIYGNDYMKKPPLPWHMKKISATPRW